MGSSAAVHDSSSDWRSQDLSTPRRRCLGHPPASPHKRGAAGTAGSCCWSLSPVGRRRGGRPPPVAGRINKAKVFLESLTARHAHASQHSTAQHTLFRRTSTDVTTMYMCGGDAPSQVHVLLSGRISADQRHPSIRDTGLGVTTCTSLLCSHSSARQDKAKQSKASWPCRSGNCIRPGWPAPHWDMTVHFGPLRILRRRFGSHRHQQVLHNIFLPHSGSPLVQITATRPC